MTRSIEESLDIMAGSRIAELVSTFTRPNTTTQYTSGDIVSGSLDLNASQMIQFALPDAVKDLGGNVYKMLFSKSGDTTTSATFNLHLFSRPITVNAVDNTPFLTQFQAHTYRDSFIGIIAAPTLTLGKTGGGVSGVTTQANVYNTYFGPLPDGIIYAFVVAGASYTPAALEQFYIKLWVTFP